MVIFQTDEYPAFVDATGKGAFFPTRKLLSHPPPQVYTVSEFPSLVPTLRIKEKVETLILSGGNLTWAGVSNKDDLGQFFADDVFKVVTSDHKLIALAAIACSFDDENKIKDAEIAAHILHTKSDKLWEHGSQVAFEFIDEEPKK